MPVKYYSFKEYHAGLLDADYWQNLQRIVAEKSIPGLDSDRLTR